MRHCRYVTIILVALLLPALCLAAPKKKPVSPDDRSLKAVGKVAGDNRQRVALVIGNSSYVASPLRNPVNDARIMTATLRRLGFEVVERTNLGYAAMNEAIDTFGEKLRPGGIALFYYAGHGMQVGGNNYLIPVDARINTENEVRYKSVDAGLVLAKMESAKSDINIAILDACRDNPFARSFRSATKGLAQVDAPTGTIIAYATAPGKTAADGDGRNGVYTEALVKALEIPGLKVEEVFKQVRRLVMEKTTKLQTPWESSSLVGDFHFIQPAPVISQPPVVTQQKSVVVDESTRNKLRQTVNEILEQAQQGDDRNVHTLKELAQQGNPDAQGNLARMYFNGWGVAKDYDEGLIWARKAAEQGNSDGRNLIGLCLNNGLCGLNKDSNEAFKWFRQAAEQGNARGQLNLGLMYQHGQGVLKDEAEAVKWYRKAAEQGEAVGQYNLGVMYFQGKGITQNDTEAFKWFRQSAEQGYASAQSNLGVMYEFGRGVVKDEREAVRWYRKAAEQGDGTGQYNHGLMYLQGMGVTQDDTEAVKWFRKASEQGKAGAQSKLGLMYELGRGVVKDEREAVRWYRKAAEQGHPEGQKSLGLMYLQGRGVTQDDTEAFKCFRQAAEQGHHGAQANLGSMYQLGRGVVKDEREAVRWYRKAAELGNAFGQYNLGIMYEYGRGIEKNWDEAIKWYRKAAEQGDEDAKAALKRLNR